MIREILVIFSHFVPKEEIGMLIQPWQPLEYCRPFNIVHKCRLPRSPNLLYSILLSLAGWLKKRFGFRLFTIPTTSFSAAMDFGVSGRAVSGRLPAIKIAAASSSSSSSCSRDHFDLSETNVLLSALQLKHSAF